MFLRQTMAVVEVIYFEAGAGHRSTAHSLKAYIDSLPIGLNLKLVNLQELLDPIDIFRQLTGLRLQDIYNLLLEKGWTLGTPWMARFVQAVIAFYHPKIVALLKEHWRTSRPDLVVSVIPNFNRALYESLKETLVDVPFVTLLTDFADYPPHFWIEPQPQYFICGTERAYQQCLAMGHPPERVYRVSGMVIHPKFYEPPMWDRTGERKRLGLNPNKLTALVFFGGYASSKLRHIAKKLDLFSNQLQAIFLCGKNEKVAHSLEKSNLKLQRLVVPYTTQVPYYMYLSDFMIGKPGPGCISEALTMGLPVIVDRNAWTLPQERYNTDWVREHGVGIVLKSFRHLDKAIRLILDQGFLETLKANVKKIQNRAIFEVVPVLCQLVGKRPVLSSK